MLKLSCIFILAEPPSRILQIVATTTGVVLNLVEMACYIVYFHHIYDHDKGVAHLFKEDEVRRRVRRNAISFVGQFYGFCTECLFLGFFTIAIMKGKSYLPFKAFAQIIKFTEFGALSIVEVVTCQEMRTNLVNRWKRLLGLFSYFLFWF